VTVILGSLSERHWPFRYGNCGCRSCGTKATQVYTDLHIFDNGGEHVFDSSMEPMECSAEQRLSFLAYRRGLLGAQERPLIEQIA
jgi:hypothetical protein